MAEYPIETVLDILNETYPYHPMGDVTSREPYKVLMCCLLSLRSRDTITMPACMRLFEVADTPEKMVALDRETLMQLIYPVKFYAHKAQVLQEVSQELLDRFGGHVPDNVETLDTIKGVGRKTANLAVSLGYNLPAISVDTHVHRICNRLGYVVTKTPDETEQVLRQKLPRQYWLIINRVMVRHGQEICRPLGPLCKICPVAEYCYKVDVKAQAVASVSGRDLP